MSTMAVPDIAVAPVDEGFWTRTRKVGLTLLGLGLISAVLFGALATDQPARFTLSEDAAGAALKINGTVGAILFGVVAIAAGAAMLAGLPKRWFTLVLGIGLVGFVLSFLCWQVSAAPAGQNFMPLVNMVRGTFVLALPLIFGALAGVLCERSGVVNVAIEGQLLMGAFSGALFGSISGSVWVGLVAAAIGGAFISLLLAIFAIRYLVDQVVMGIVLNLLAVGITGFLYERLMQTNAQRYNSAPRFSNWEIPLLKDIPVLGPALFRGNIFLYLGLLLVLVIHIALFRTRWGLRTRAVGEHPTAADTLGVRVLGLRYRNVLLAGVVAGIGGASYTLALYSFTKNMIGGKGFIALAALIFGRWSPTGALLAALFFGFADQLGTYLGAINSVIPSQFLAMLPYLATILAVAGLVGRVRAPAADGKPYIKG
ncbi:nucleoside ABC transporter membrane protein [Micromonospora echinaurantiaca]|uniref:Nucleoside ABC transporter membrane protein n=1 Tax=Micromonospora echinaurantiaca TaxID=47857 RepID=A0A1C5JYL9_9ACTN|nr:ABC transporter permease [Micromonospora echinaurantiaca]SCG75431.1 nucleoside ABC transporter membrane protein [Micromonospora echinaurantiaca]